ncbi:MAG: hypothetical protein KDJ26_06365 [Alphaproteobacteria bacterium]|jgi:hypothetical protein|nr:hypothetical protein [Alphaproteobacteria bacterium]MCB1551606.1 hypothetical protein [Alphaproteobacteria bacterium]MCB9985808.1 hypothetical protein [Micavibrio sp.]HPQ50050.1 hypothetical protein [Alphaproteobacteria bacterium]
MQHSIQQEIYTYRPNPLLERSYLLFRRDGNGENSPIGDYTILDEQEDLSLAEKKLMNIVMQLNGDDNLLQLGEQTRSRLYFHCKPKAEDDPRQTIVFYTYTGQGVSKENSILTLEGFNHE